MTKHPAEITAPAGPPTVRRRRLRRIGRALAMAAMALLPLLWVDSFRAYTDVSLQRPGSRVNVGIVNNEGSLLFGAVVVRPETPASHRPDREHVVQVYRFPKSLTFAESVRRGPWWYRLGFRGWFGTSANGVDEYCAGLSHWLILIILVLIIWPPTRWHRPRLPGVCSQCGYDLRATPDRCPECGHVPAAADRSRAL